MQIQKDYNFNYCPRTTVLTPKRALLDMKCESDRDCLITISDCLHSGIRVTFKKWSPGEDTLSSTWFQPKLRWLVLVGIPYHLTTYETVAFLCGRFGSVVEYGNIGVDMHGKSGVRVKVKVSDARLIPQFLPLVDIGEVVYPIRVYLDENENGEDDRLEAEESQVKVGTGGRCRSYAELASGDWQRKKPRVEWRSRVSASHSRVSVSRVAKTPTFGDCKKR